MARPPVIPVSALTRRVLNSLDSKSRGVEADADLVGELKLAASRGDHEAVELLGNLALGANSDRQQIAKLATRALLELSTDPEVSDEIRYSIRAFSLDAVTSECDWSSSTKQNKSKERAFVIPTPLLSLALPEVKKRGHANIERHLETTLEARLKGISDRGKALVSPERFCTSEEIFSALDAGLETSKSVSDALSLERMPFMADEPSFEKSFMALAGNAVKGKGCHAAVIKHGGHWVAVVVGPSTKKSGKLDIVVYDTFHATNSEKANQLTQKIKGAVDPNLLGSLTYAGQNVQGNTNGCAPLCTRALRGLREKLAGNSGPASMKTVVDFLQSDLERLDRWSRETLEGVVAGLRAEMLEATEATFKNNADAQCHDRPDSSKRVNKSKTRIVKKSLRKLVNSGINFGPEPRSQRQEFTSLHYRVVTQKQAEHPNTNTRGSKVRK